MAIDLVDYEKKAAEAVRLFWNTREEARQKQIEEGKPDIGERGSVTAGKHMDGFVSLIVDTVKGNGLSHAHIHTRPGVLKIPGYFRSTKCWDVLVINDGRLIAAIELKSHVGSFSNNFNNRAEEAIGTGEDFKVAYREDAFGKNPRPFVGWLMLVEEAVGSLSEVRDASPHFPIFDAFKKASYLDRYKLLCQRMTQEQLYTTACIIASPKEAIKTGEYRELDSMTGLKTFVALLAGHIAAEAARSTGVVMKRVPLYDLKAAAGNFSEQRVENKEWVNVPDEVRVTDDLFACTVVGESMNQVIPNGSICLFNKYSGGSRDGEIVLVQLASLQDTDLGAGYTVKEYHSTKKQLDDGQWVHDTITLSPVSDDTGFKVIELRHDEASSLKVIGIFVRVLEIRDGVE